MHEDAGTHRGRKFLTDLCIGGTAATISKTMMAPMERIKLLLQVHYLELGSLSKPVEIRDSEWKWDQIADDESVNQFGTRPKRPYK